MSEPSQTGRRTDGPQTPETYLGYARLESIVGSPIRIDEEAEYALPEFVPGEHVRARRPLDDRARASDRRSGASLRLEYLGEHVYLVLGAPPGGGLVEVNVDGEHVKTVLVEATGSTSSYRSAGEPRFRTLDLRFTPGVEAYAFTFG